MASPTQITISQLSRLIGTPNGPILIDVRIDEDFEDDQRLIPTSFRYHFSDVGSLSPRFKSERVVVICQKGRKLSEGAAAVLRDHGISAEALEGGHFAWRDANEPLIPASKLPKPNSENRTVWVTRHRPKIDRIACPWLIRRFVDPNAQFLFVAPSEVIDVAEKFEATPFDIEDVFWSHRGERCTFDIMIEEFSLEIAPLRRLATVVRGADTDRHDISPEAEGLLAASLGLSRMYRTILPSSMQEWCSMTRSIVGHAMRLMKVTTGRRR